MTSIHPIDTEGDVSISKPTSKFFLTRLLTPRERVYPIVQDQQDTSISSSISTKASKQKKEEEEEEEEIDHQDKKRAKLLSALKGQEVHLDFSSILPSGLIRVFLSSTFTDTEAERNQIIEKISPQIQQYALERSIRVLLVELRWGIHDIMTNDHRTWEICQEELEKCFHLSMGIFFISLVSEKYGWRPLPRTLSEKKWDLIKKKSTQEQSTKMDALYAKDLNVVPPKWTLKVLNTTQQRQVFDTCMAEIRDHFTFVLNLQQQELEDNTQVVVDKVGQSITHWETNAAIKTKDIHRMIWCHRQFSFGGSTNQMSNDNIYKDFMDFDSTTCQVDTNSRQLLKHVLHHDLTTQMGQVHTFDAQLIKSQVMRRVNTNTSCFQQMDGFVPNASYLNEMSTFLTDILQKDIDQAACQMKTWKQHDALNTGLSKNSLEECIHHLQWAHKKQKKFFGRQEIVNSIIQQLILPSKTQILGLYGISGSGKTALLSQIGHVLSHQKKQEDTMTTTWVLYRFCGTSRYSTTGFDLVNSLCQQILVCLNLAHELTNIPLKYKDLVDFFHTILKSKIPKHIKIYLLIDSLDQLVDTDQSRSKLNFLLTTNPPSNVTFVLTCLPDESYGCLTRMQQVLQIPCIQVPCLLEKETKDILFNVLLQNGRSIQNDGLLVQIQQALCQNPSPLFLTLVVSICKKYTSYDIVPSYNFLLGIQEAIHFILEDMEKTLGQQLVSHTLAYITFSRFGLSVEELLDLLSLDDQVLNELFKFWKPPVQRVPQVPLLRLLNTLEQDLFVLKKDLYQWYHRQLWLVAEQRYESIKQNIRDKMAKYFTRHLSLSQKRLAVSCIAQDSPLLFTTSGEGEPNVRRCQEGAYQLYHLMLEHHHKTELELEYAIKLTDEICQLDAMEARARTNDTELFDCIGYLLDLNQVLERHKETNGRYYERAKHYLYWIRREGYLMKRNPAMCHVSAITQPQPCSVVYQDANERQTNRIACSICPPIGRFDPCLSKLEGHTEGISSIVLMHDKTIYSGAEDGVIRIWDIKTGVCDKTLEDSSHQNGGVACLRVLTNDKLLAGYQDGSIRLWDAIKGASEKCFKGHTDRVESLAWIHHTNQFVSSSRDNTLRVWHLDSGGICETTLEGHTDIASGVVVTPDGAKAISSSFDNTLRVWNLSDRGICEKILEGHKDQVLCVALDAGSLQVVSGSGDWTIRLWDLNTGGCTRVLEGHFDRVTSLAVSSFEGNNLIISGSRDLSVRVWDFDSGECTKILEGHSGRVTAVAMTQDGSKIISGSLDKALRIWDATMETSMSKSSNGHSREIMNVAFSLDGTRVFSGSSDGTIRVWDTTNGQYIETFEGHDAGVNGVRISPDGKYLASGSDDTTLRIWELSTGKCDKVLEGFSREITSVAWSFDGSKIAASSWDGKVHVCDVVSGACEHSFKGHTHSVTSVVFAFSQSNNQIVSGSWDKTVRVWDLDSKTCLKVLTGHTAEVTTVAVSSDGKMILSGSYDNTVRVWQLDTGICLRTLEGHTGWVLGVAWDPQDQQILSAACDLTIRLWDFSSKKCLQILEGHTSGVISLAITKNGTKIASGSYDQTIRIWT